MLVYTAICGSAKYRFRKEKLPDMQSNIDKMDKSIENWKFPLPKKNNYKKK